MTADLYATLGVDKKASSEEIKKAFRRKAKKHHPDTNPGDKEATKHFQEIVLANKILSDPDKRSRYDQTGDTSDQPDNKIANLVSILSQVFQNTLGSLLEQHKEPKYQDMIQEMKNWITKHLAELAENKKMLAQSKTIIEPMLPKFKVQKSQENLMQEVVKWEMEKLDREIARLVQVEVKMLEALEYLKSCSYSKDKNQVDEFKVMYMGTMVKVQFGFNP